MVMHHCLHISDMFVVIYFIPDHDASARSRYAAGTHAVARPPSATATPRARPTAASGHGDYGRT
eukprot:2830897-Pleurochrysis_carterae.AAC.2